MRYTTIIDFRGTPSYNNPTARLVYLEMTLAAGYHDDDRDLVVTSFRIIAARLGITLSAVRHAVKQLERDKLLEHSAGVWRVKKWLPEQLITPRKIEEQRSKERNNSAAITEARREQQSALEKEHQRLDAIRAGKDPFLEYYENMMIKAQSGDEDAARIVEQRRAMYEQIKAKQQ